MVSTRGLFKTRNIMKPVILSVAFFSLLTSMNITVTWALRNRGQMAIILLVVITFMNLAGSICMYGSSEIEIKEPVSSRMQWLEDHTLYPVGLLIVVLTLAEYCLILGLTLGNLEALNERHGHIIDFLLLGTVMLNTALSFYAVGILP